MSDSEKKFNPKSQLLLFCFFYFLLQKRVHSVLFIVPCLVCIFSSSFPPCNWKKSFLCFKFLPFFFWIRLNGSELVLGSSWKGTFICWFNRWFLSCHGNLIFLAFCCRGIHGGRSSLWLTRAWELFMGIWALLHCMCTKALLQKTFSTLRRMRRFMGFFALCFGLWHLSLYLNMCS